MTNIKQILRLLAEKKELFLEVESITSDMCVEQVEALITCMDKRSKLLARIETLDEEIKELCAGDEPVRGALNHACNRDSLAKEFIPLYDASLGVKAVVNRIMQNEDTVRQHLEFEKQRIVEQVEELNSSGFVVADKYHRSVQTGQNRHFGDGTDQMI